MPKVESARAAETWEEYAACGVCFLAPKGALRRVTGLKSDGCVFKFVGQGISVEGEHSPWVHNHAASGGKTEALPKGGVRSTARSTTSFSHYVWFPERGSYPALSTRFSYDAKGLSNFVSRMSSSVERCTSPTTRVDPSFLLPGAGDDLVDAAAPGSP